MYILVGSNMGKSEGQTLVDPPPHSYLEDQTLVNRSVHTGWSNIGEPIPTC